MEECAVTEDIEAIVKSVVSERFPGGKIERISVRRDVDYDGDPGRSIQMVIQTGEVIDSKKASGSARHLRSKLAENRREQLPPVFLCVQDRSGEVEDCGRVIS